MPQLILMSAVGIGGATAFGYLGAAAMETDTGRALLAVLAVLVAVLAIVETMRMTQTARKI